MIQSIPHQAPDFAGTYPSSGELIGPAWQAAWDALCKEGWIPGDELAQIMCACVNIELKTAKNLLRQARKVGVLSAKREGASRYSTPDYRIAKSGDVE
jgi:hypothetical protein